MPGSAPLDARARPTPKPPSAHRGCPWLAALAVGTAVALLRPAPVGAQGGEPTVCARIEWVVAQPEAAMRQGLSELPSMMAVLGLAQPWAVEHEQYEAALLARARELTHASIAALRVGAEPIGENPFGIPADLPPSLSDILLSELSPTGLQAAPSTTARPVPDEAVAAVLQACGLPATGP
jgi:hypothetical protein